MKKIKNNLFIAAFSFMGMINLASCENAEKGAIENAIYVSEANQNIDKKVPIDDKGAVTTLTVRAANVVSSKIVVSFKKDESLLDNYNKRYGTNYKALPDNMYEIVDPVVEIAAGEVSALSTNVKFKPLTEEMTSSGDKFALPVVIADIQGGLSALDNAKGIIYLLDQVIVTSVPVIGKIGGVGAPIVALLNTRETDYNLATWAFEMRVNMSRLGEGVGILQNQSIWRVTVPQGYKEVDGEVFIRFGASNLDGRTLQVKMKGGSAQLECKTVFNAKQWYHLAFVSNGTKVSVYVDGELDSTIDLPAGNFHFGGPFKICSTPNYFAAELMVSEVRFWTREISQSEIKNNMFAINPQSEGLEGYWKMNEGQGTQFIDATSHSTPGCTENNKVISWVHGVRSDQK